MKLAIRILSLLALLTVFGSPSVPAAENSDNAHCVAENRDKPRAKQADTPEAKKKKQEGSSVEAESAFGSESVEKKKP